MTSYTVTQRTPLFQAANMVSPRLGIAEAGTDIEGAADTGGFVKTRIDSVAVGDGFISILALADRPTLPQPIPDDMVGVFIALVTRMARDLATDRDYLLAVAYAATNNLKALGGAADARLGPFQYTEKEWKDAITAGPAREQGFAADDRYRWSSQAEVAARLAADATRRFKDALGRPPKFPELYFTQLLGEHGIRSPEGRSKRQMQRRHQGSAGGIVRRRARCRGRHDRQRAGQAEAAPAGGLPRGASRDRQAAARNPLLSPRRGRERGRAAVGHRRPGGDGARRLGDAGKQEQR